jgi:hypothetical protein
MPATYEPIATYTAPSVQSSITFSSLGSYTDIRIVANMMDSNQYGLLRFNSDSGANYSRTWMYGTGTAAASNRTTGDTSAYWGATASGSQFLLNEFNIMNYSNSTTNKTLLARQTEGQSGGSVSAFVYLWRNTSAITSISFVSAGGGGGSNTIAAGSSITLYGIKAA